ncbi:YcaO-like family protein [Kitasatospora phosalacinea]|uniref:YcaO-like family protein n=1 Tax=Kitasatospora phosalacinea TaxID=2065 RepID=UPI003651AFB9
MTENTKDIEDTTVTEAIATQATVPDTAATALPVTETAAVAATTTETAATGTAAVAAPGAETAARGTAVMAVPVTEVAAARVTATETAATGTSVTGTAATEAPATESTATETSRRPPARPAVAGPRLGPGAPVSWDWRTWAGRLDGCLLSVRGEYDPEWERRAMAAARAAGTDLLSVRIGAAEIQIGPRWTPDGEPACPGCAAAADGYRRWDTERRPENDRRERERERAADSPSAADGHRRGDTGRRPESDRREGEPEPEPGGEGELPAPGRVVPVPPWLEDVVGAVLTGQGAPGPGELVVVSRTGGVSRHRVMRTFRCRLCGGGPPLLAGADDAPPVPPRPVRRPTAAEVPTRQGPAPFAMDPDRMRAAFADPRFGPVVRITRYSAGSFPMSEVDVLAGTPSGLGRGLRFREAEAVGMFEAMERQAGYPHAATVVPWTTHRELGDRALDPATLGGYTDRQFASPSSKVRRWTADTPLDWVWARPPLGGEPRLVPAEVGFYRYGYRIRPEAAEDTRSAFLESSSGCALGGSFEEAALHSLLELAERDAFLQAWHLARPLPAVDPATVRDRQSRLLLKRAEEHGYDVHLLVATADIPVPAVWALAVRRDGGLPASFSTAGCHPDPEQAVRSALWELAQLVTGGLTWDPEPLEPLIDDPWQVEELVQHWRRYTFPELLPRVERVLGGPLLPLAEAFGGWPRPLVRAAGGDVTGALEYVLDLYRTAGLGTVLAVDQSTPDHAALGLSVVKCVVPGILPMCFGQAHQRLSGLDRLLSRLDADPADLPLDPHPFP